eukprot:scaffold25506_cov59-Phaeocystis_antarctica.AAC.1
MQFKVEGPHLNGAEPQHLAQPNHAHEDRSPTQPPPGCLPPLATRPGINTPASSENPAIIWGIRARSGSRSFSRNHHYGGRGGGIVVVSTPLPSSQRVCNKHLTFFTWLQLSVAALPPLGWPLGCAEAGRAWSRPPSSPSSCTAHPVHTHTSRTRERSRSTLRQVEVCGQRERRRAP